MALGSVLAMRPSDDGPVLRTTAIGGEPGRIVVDEQTGRAFVVNRLDNTVSVLDAATGALRATVAVGAMPRALALDARTARVFVTNGADDTVSVLDARSGGVLRTIRVGLAPAGVAVDERTTRVFVADHDDNTVSVLDARTGSVLNAVSVSSLPSVVGVDERAGHVFVRGDTGDVAMLDARSGAVLHSVRVGNNPWGMVAVDEGTARAFVVNPDDRTVSMLDTRSGALLRTIGIAGFAALDERTERLFVSGYYDDERGRIYVLDARSGALLHTIALGSPTYCMVVDEQTGRVLVGTLGATDSDGHVTGTSAVTVLDGHSGTVRESIPVGIAPISMALDTRTRRVFVANLNTNLDGSPIPVTGLRAWWAQALQQLRDRLRWLPFPVPDPPAPSLKGSVTTLDLSHL